MSGWAYTTCSIVVVTLAGCAVDDAGWAPEPSEAGVSQFERLPAVVQESLARQYFPLDPTSFRVTLQRTHGCCGGKYPVFTLVVGGDASVEYTGQANVDEIGMRQRAISPEGLRALHEAFALTDFFQLREEYGMAWIGPPDSILTLEIDGRSHRVTNRRRLGMHDGDPTELQDRLWELAEHVIDTARAREWIRR
jgi:hypothetical protein